MAARAQGTFKTRWEWDIARTDDAALWIGTIKQSTNASPSAASFITYEHGDSPEESTFTHKGLPHPEWLPDAPCAELWPAIDEYLRFNT